MEKTRSIISPTLPPFCPWTTNKCRWWWWLFSFVCFDIYLFILFFFFLEGGWKRTLAIQMICNWGQQCGDYFWGTRTASEKWKHPQSRPLELIIGTLFQKGCWPLICDLDIRFTPALHCPCQSRRYGDNNFLPSFCGWSNVRKPSLWINQ